MSYPHRIRLRGPWEAEPLEPAGESRRVALPARLGESGLTDCRRVRFRRRFGRPRQIDPHERVWIVGEPFSGFGSFAVNGKTLGAISGSAGPFAFPVTELITERNDLTVDFTAESAGDGLSGDIALEIRCTAFLANLSAESVAENRLRIGGQVPGEAEGRLDVYVLADGKTIGYRQCAAGQDFDLLTDSLPDAPTELRIELVNGGVVWYAADLTTEIRQV